MRILIIADTQIPVSRNVSHGLGHSVLDIAQGLHKKHTLFLSANYQSEFPYGTLLPYKPIVDDRVCFDDEVQRHKKLMKDFPQIDIVFDSSHLHLYNKVCKLPTLNRICDILCEYNPPNIIVNTPFLQKTRYPNAKIIKTGIDTTNIPFYDNRQKSGKWLFIDGAEPKQGQMIRNMVCDVYLDIDIVRNIYGNEKWRKIGHTPMLIHPSNHMDVAPRLPLEAAACGTPTVCLNTGGTPYHVEHGITGHICKDEKELQEYLLTGRGEFLASACKNWVLENHSYTKMIRQYEEHLIKVLDGETW